ncbi:putative ethanolamine kinase [Hibiscus syriacus]|uniref:ethanolamine kinase n=1 Tax=Hibiscus syriacus TaxID=106335 RepID=A0A6A3AEG0_HIBSY|nr:putative ethanolamine kinase [Hibiscus syriacus]
MGATKSISTAMEANQAKQTVVNGNSSGGDSIPHSNVSVDTALSFPLMATRVIALFKDMFPKWAELNESCFSVETVSGGITNLWSAKDMLTTSSSKGIEKMVLQSNTSRLQDWCQAAWCIWKWDDDVVFFTHQLFGRVYACEHLSLMFYADNINMRKPKLASEIAKQLRRFHQVEIPGSKEPQLWVDLFKFFEKASSLQFEDTDKQKIYETISFQEVHKEATQLKELTGLLHSPVVFAHNDLLSGNLMHNDEQEKLYFIDFEYGSYNYRGFDIGNHFNEYAGYDCDYSLYPSKDEQYHFFRHYLQPEKPYEVSEKDLEALYVEANTFMLASHLQWALWALIQARMSPIDFDYIGYFLSRYNEYRKQKETIVALAKSHLSRSGKA